MADPEMSMNQIIHAAVRRDLARTAAALRALTDGDVDRARGIQRAWEYLRHELKHHHEGEDQHIFPFLRERGDDGALLDAMESEHHELAEALSSGQQAIDVVVADPTSSRADDAAEVVDRSAQVIARHLEHEERDVEPLIHEHKTDPAFKEAERKVRHPQLSAAGDFLAWVQDGATEREVTALKQTIPAPIVMIISALFGRGYRRDIAPVWKA